MSSVEALVSSLVQNRGRIKELLEDPQVRKKLAGLANRIRHADSTNAANTHRETNGVAISGVMSLVVVAGAVTAVGAVSLVALAAEKEVRANC